MDPITLAAIMGGVGLLQGGQQDRQMREQMKLNSMQQRFAPLFGQAPGAPQAQQTPSALASGLSGALGGYQTGMNYQMMSNALRNMTQGPANQGWTYDKAIGPEMPQAVAQATGLTAPAAPAAPAGNIGPMASGNLYAQLLGDRR